MSRQTSRLYSREKHLQTNVWKIKKISLVTYRKATSFKLGEYNLLPSTLKFCQSQIVKNSILEEVIWVHMWQVSCILLGSALPNSSWVVISPPGVREVMGSIPVGDSDFFLLHVCVMLNISSFTPNYRAQNSPSSFTYHNFVYVNIFMSRSKTF